MRALASSGPLLATIACLGALPAAAAGCAGTTRSVFRPSDAAFQPRPGPAPRVYLAANLAELPKVPMRSVGVIEVTVSKRGGIERAIEVAREEGRRLGCWILVEHAVFASLRPSAALHDGAVVLLAHGAGISIGHTHGPRSLTADFDCVVPAAGPAPGTTAARSHPGEREGHTIGHAAAATTGTL